MHDSRFGTVMPEDFRRIREIFEAALERPHGERRAFVAAACDGNPLLVAEVERMLDAEATRFSMLDGPAQASPRRRDEPVACASCGAPLAASQRFCGACGSPTHGSGSDEGRFRAGTLFANRFRIVARLGRGGMGEVYRADDLEVGQPVALKFLTGPGAGPAKAGHYVRFDERARARLRSEVRLARQISHPNVCRVYDIGESQGELFLSMEYVDGEDLASLLTRIGRLPIDKGIEIARKLCAGLAAAHAKGVLHRDFKPANIMIDSHGEVRIMDFGLAAIASELEASEVRSGTPAYMAPEQLAGKEASKQSDIYALGLVLYEVFTGKLPFEAKDLEQLLQLRQAHPSTTPSTLIPEITPRLERAILQCLDPDPRRRPASALDLSTALPGGDPLADALAAGETPSPQIVAAAGPKESLRAPVAIALLGCICVGLAAWCWLTPKIQMVSQLPFEFSPEVLASKGREIAASVGYTARPVDVAFGFRDEPGYIDHIKRNVTGTAAERKRHWLRMISSAPSPIAFWYREADAPMLPSNPVGVVTPQDPSQETGTLSVDLGLDGRLLRLIASRDSAAGVPTDATVANWPVLFGAARLDIARFTMIERTVGESDERAIWTGVYPGPGMFPVQVIAEATRGIATRFEVTFPWTARVNTSLQQHQTSALVRVLRPTILGIGTVVLVLVARRNWKTGRVDRTGTWRLAVFAFIAILLGAALVTHDFLALFRPQLGVSALGSELAFATAYAVWAAAYYVALEPWVRRMWPHVLITWTRVLAGHWRDPLVGRDILIGLTGAVLVSCAHRLLYLWITSNGGAPAGVATAGFEGFGAAPFGFTLVNLVGGRWSAGAALLGLGAGLSGGLGILYVLFVSRVLLQRHPWLALALAFVITSFVGFAPLFAGANAADLGFLAAVGAVLTFLMVRYGVFALTVWVWFGQFVEHAMLTPNFGAWYGQSSLMAVILVSAAALWAFYTSLGGRSVFGPSALSR